MKSISDIFKTLALKVKKILWFLGLHAFLLILLIIFVEVVLGGLIFCKYVFLAENKEPQITKNIVRFDDKTYQVVSRELSEKGLE